MCVSRVLHGVLVCFWRRTATGMIRLVETISLSCLPVFGVLPPRLIPGSGTGTEHVGVELDHWNVIGVTAPLLYCTTYVSVLHRPLGLGTHLERFLVSRFAAPHIVTTFRK